MASHKQRHCFVPGCKTGYRLTRKENAEKGVRNKQLFSAPDPEVRAIWEQVICRTDRPLTRFDVVCELHFKEEDIEKCYETKLPGGVIHRIERARYGLKKNAVPSIFPPPGGARNCKKQRGTPVDGPLVVPSTQDCEISESSVPSSIPPPDTSNSQKDWGCPVERPSVAPCTQDCDESEMGEDYRMIEVKTELFDFQVLMTDALNISLPSDMWTVGILKENQVIFANWSDGKTFEAKKRVLIDTELHIKIFLGNVKASLGKMKEVHSLEEIAEFLVVIDQLDICQSTRSPDCLGYITARDVSEEGTSDTMCHICRKAEKDSLRLYSGKEVVGGVGMQRKILKIAFKSSQPCDQIHKKRKLLPEKGVIPDGNPSPEQAVKRVCGEECDEWDNEIEEGEEIEVEERAPPKRCSQVTQLHLLSPTPADTTRPISSPCESIERRQEEVASPLDIETLVRDVHRIPLPSDAWTRGVVKGKCLIFASWKEGKLLEAEKRLVVDEDLSVKVVFGNMILALDEIRNVKKIEDVDRYLYIVDRMSKCYGIGTGRRAASCPGYFIPGQVQGMGSCLSRCAYCQGASEELIRISRVSGGLGQVRAEAQEKAWKNLKMLSDLYPGLKKGVKASVL